MKYLATALILLTATAASAQEQLTPLQQYLYNESGYAPPHLAAAPAIPAPQPYATAYVPAEPTPAYVAEEAETGDDIPLIDF